MALCSLLDGADDLRLFVALCSLYVISEPGYICIFVMVTRICFKETCEYSGCEDKDNMR
jgi:hypothetical protein